MSTIKPLPNTDRWAERLVHWSHRLQTARLDGLVRALLDAAEPLGPLGAQLLWIAQPTLSLFVPREEVTALARLLDAPGGVTWIRSQLEPQTVTEQTDTKP